MLVAALHRYTSAHEVRRMLASASGFTTYFFRFCTSRLRATDAGAVVATQSATVNTVALFATPSRHQIVRCEFQLLLATWR